MISSLPAQVESVFGIELGMSGVSHNVSFDEVWYVESVDVVKPVEGRGGTLEVIFCRHGSVFPLDTVYLLDSGCKEKELLW